MKTEQIVKLLEGLLFIAGDGIAFDDIIGRFDIDKEMLDTALTELKNKYDSNSGINVILLKNKVQLSTNPDLADMISEILNPIRERSLTKAALETVAIIAYKQPITRAEIENVRGVNSDYAVDLLLTNDLVEVKGRKDAVGKPLLFGTTDTFLKRFDISSIEDLPDYNKLLDRIRVIHSGGDSLYREFDIPEDDSVLLEENDSDVILESDEGDIK